MLFATLGLGMILQQAAPPPGRPAAGAAEAATPLADVTVVADPRFGVVVLNCEALASGRLTDCQILSEAPSGRGFGEAALKGARDARLGRQRDHVEGARVTFTVRFQRDD